ncbi:MAG TPA: hypothetical protein PKV73_05100 [Agriterribacter sp.]|nr:hypothetical protein [Agriterribacter sp.]
MNNVNVKKMTVIVLMLFGFNMSSIHAQPLNTLDAFSKLYDGLGKDYFKPAFKTWPQEQKTTMFSTPKYETKVFVDGARECFLSPYGFALFMQNIHNNFMSPAGKDPGYMYTASFGPFSSLSLAENKVKDLQKPILKLGTAKFSKDIFSNKKDNEIIHWYLYQDDGHEFVLYRVFFEVEGSKGAYKVNYKLVSSGVDKSGKEISPMVKFTLIEASRESSQLSTDIQRAIKEGESEFKSVTSDEKLPENKTKNIKDGNLKSTFIFADYPDCYISKGFRTTDYNVLIAPYYDQTKQELETLSKKIDKALGDEYVKLGEVSEDGKAFTVKYVKKDKPFKIVMTLIAEKKSSTDNQYAVRLIF